MENEKKISNPTKLQIAESHLIESEKKLKNLEGFLKWICIDQSNPWRASFSCFTFFIFAIAIPLLSHFALSCSNCDEDHGRPYHVIVQISLSVFAAISFACLSWWFRKYGLRRFLFLDKLASPKAEYEYSKQLQRSMELISYFVVPCFMGEAGYKIYWYISGANEIPFYGNNMYISYVAGCALELSSWVYRTSIFLVVCILYRLICRLQMIRLEDFGHVFRQQTEVESILMEHLGLRRTLKIISHRFRVFTLLSLLLVTASQFISLLLITKTNARVNFTKAGQLALCSMSLVTGTIICLRSAAKITHKAQSITCLAAKWHVSATMDTFDGLDGETPTTPQIPIIESDTDEEEEDEEEMDDAKLMPVFAHTISFQKRHALVIYLKNNKAGISVYGFMVDRTWLKSIFAIELALVLWLLNKTIGI